MLCQINKKRLEAYGKRGIKLGTERTRAVLDGLGSPDKNLKIVHIAGSNGKGSVAEFITQILLAAGKRVGTFTSPAVYCYEDMFRVDGVPIPRRKLDGYLKEASEYGGRVEATEFETETAAAVYAFYKEGCEYAVIECGMGGTYDATNAVGGKEVAVITSVSLEHTQYLGDTLEEICVNKAGIIKDCPAVASACISGDARGYLESMGAIFAEPVENYNADELSFLYKGKKYFLSAKGIKQPYNAACAIEVARLLKIDENAVCVGVKAAKPEGRAQVFRSHGKTYILDGGHNAEALRVLAEFVKNEYKNSSKTLIYGVLSDKDVRKNAEVLADMAEEVIAVSTFGARGVTAHTVAENLKYHFSKVNIAADLDEALRRAAGETVIVCGTFTILKEAKLWIEKE